MPPPYRYTQALGLLGQVDVTQSLAQFAHLLDQGLLSLTP